MKLNNQISQILCTGFFLTMANLVSAWTDFEAELDDYLSNFNGVRDQYIRGESIPQGYFVPQNKSDIESRWYTAKETVRQSIGSVSPKPGSDSAVWQNSANSVDELFDDSSNLASYFAEDVVEALVARVPGASHTGFDHIQKTKASIQSKVNRDYADGVYDPIKWVGDGLRAAIVINTVEQHQDVITELNRIIEQEGHKIVYKNIYEQSYESGYVGVHAKLKLYNGFRVVLAELQIHFRSINDGTNLCPNKYSHLAYEIVRAFDSNDCDLDEIAKRVADELVANGNSAEKIIYLFGLEDILHDNISGRKRSTLSENECIVNGTSYYSTKGFVLKATHTDIDDSIVAIQVYDPRIGLWSDNFEANGPNNDGFELYLTWINNEDADETTGEVKDYGGDDSLCIDKDDVESVILALRDEESSRLTSSGNKLTAANALIILINLLIAAQLHIMY